MRKIALCLITIFCALNLFAQTSGTTYNVDLPQLLPASPEPSAFVKSGVGNVNLSTGAATANIPLYSIKVKDFSFPISLSYSAQGLKADEASSRVGYGWILNATGMITRIVKGKPDEMAYRLKPPSDMFADTDSVFNYLNAASSESSGYDTQADEFQFNFNGYSGKFVLDSNYIPRVTSASNLKITVQMLVSQGGGGIDLINITTPDGVIYKFGSHYEMTITHNVQQFAVYKDRTKTAFFLDRIEMPSGEYIAFNYSPIHIRVTTGVTQTLKIGRNGGGGTGGATCVECSELGGYTSQTQTIEYNTNYLSNITTSDGRTIDLTYEARPDKSYDNRLKGLEIRGLKKYLFEYYDVPGSTSTSTGINGRFFLTKMREIKLAEVIDLSVSYDYTFTYKELANVPLPITFAQDYLGYYKGSNPANCLIPPYVNSDNTIDFSFRNPNASFSQIGMLTSIQYPTGGKEEFFYEGNTQAKTVLRDTRVTETLSGRGDESSSGLMKTYTSDTYFVLKNHKATLSLWATDADLNDGYTQTENHWTLIMDFYDGMTKISGLTSFDYNTKTLDIDLQAGHSYWWKMTVKNSTEIGHSTMNYDTASQDYYDIINEEIPGVRIKQIKYTDPATASSHSKYYTYARLENLSVSTGSGGGINFKSGAQTRHYCGQPIGEIETHCSFEIYSSSSTQDIYNYSGSGSVIYYNTVIESDDPNFANGGTEYTFYENESGSNHMTAFGQDVPGLPAGQSPTLSGSVYKTRIFDKNKQIVQEEIDDYETSIDISKAAESYYVRARYPTNIALVDRMDAFDAIKMLYGNYWIRIKTKTVKTYVGSEVFIQKTDYTYGTRENIQPATIVTTDSRNLELKTAKKYPTDFPTEGANSQLIAKNIITPVVEESSYRNGALLQQKHITYKDWFSNNTVLMPEKIQVKESPSDNLHDALLYSKYDNKGNPLQLQKVNDMPIVYLWDALYSLPLCEVKNASYDQIAFCSFECADNYGNWQLTSGSTTFPGFTGNYAFSGILTKTIATAGVYIITLWTNASATVNGANGSLLRTAKGWTLYQWKLTNPTSVSVSGTNMDDIRLYPQNAMMTTYTYQPFIGATSKSDGNNDVQYYEYDYMGRLSVVRDINNNILKKYCYNYAGEQEDCGMDMTPLWQSTGVTRCKPCPANSVYTSSIQQHEEKDNNPYSTTYNTLRWVDDGASSNCTVVADWQQINLYCEQNASGQYTGNQIKVEQDKNPCSSTYNQSRNTTALNCITCPKPADWQSTGNYRCVKDANNINTGAQEREEKDMESCSSTYNQLRWVSNGTNCATCPKPATWQSTGNYRCVKDASNANTGWQEREEKDIQTCSATYNQLRWVLNSYNTTACPVPCSSANCYGNDSKCVNGVCETGTLVVTSAVYQKVLVDGLYQWRWVCTRKYCFTDGTYSTYSEQTYQTTSCSVEFCGVSIE